MLEIARRRALELGRPVELRLGDAQALEFDDGTRCGRRGQARAPSGRAIRAARARPAEGFSIESLQRSKLGLVERLVARKPGPS